jgi:hypothetical protein
MAFWAVEAFRFGPFSCGRSLPVSSPRQWLLGRSKPSAFVNSTRAFPAVEAFQFRPLVNGFWAGRSVPQSYGFSGGRSLPLSSSSMAFQAVVDFRYRPLNKGFSSGRSLPLSFRAVEAFQFRPLVGRTKPSAFVNSTMAFPAVEAFQFCPLVNGFWAGRSVPQSNGFSCGRSLPVSSPRQWLLGRSKPSTFVNSKRAFPAVEDFPSSMAFRAVKPFPLVDCLRRIAVPLLAI